MYYVTLNVMQSVFSTYIFIGHIVIQFRLLIRLSLTCKANKISIKTVWIPNDLFLNLSAANMYSLQQHYAQRSFIYLEIQINSTRVQCMNTNFSLHRYFFLFVFFILWRSQLICHMWYVFLGVNCSEVIGKENCDRICENGTCVQMSSSSFKCTCDAGFSGKQPLFSW